MLARAVTTAVFFMVWLVTGEIYPTNLRSQALGVCSTVARIFGIGAAFIPGLSIYWKPLPMLLIGLFSLLAGGLVFHIPETRKTHLPQLFSEQARKPDINI